MLKTVNAIRPIILLSLLFASGLPGRAQATDIAVSVHGQGLYCAGSTGSVNYDGSSINFEGANVFKAQLSDASGDFSSPVEIGKLTSTSPIGTIDIKFPNDASGTGYRIRVVSSHPSITSSDNGVDLVINLVTTTSIDISIVGGNLLCSTSNATLNATITGGGTSPSYLWLVNENPVGDNSDTYNATGLQDGDVIVCKLTSSAVCATPPNPVSNAISIIRKTTATPGVSISGPPTICEGVTTEFTAQPSNGGTAPSYQWKKNGGDVGTNSATYSDNTLASGDVLSVVMTSNRDCVSVPTASASLDITVIPHVTPTLRISIEPNTPVGPGSVVYLSSTITDGGTSPVYEWKKNGSTVIGNTNAFSISTLSNGDVISAKLVSNASCTQPSTALSNEITMTIDNNLTRTGHSWEKRASQMEGAEPLNRSNATGFTIGPKGFIGLGSVTVGATTTYRKDFWQYDAANDVWTQVADFPGAARANAVGFSVNIQGFVGTGLSATGVKNDFWQYDATGNTWSQRADFPGAAREQAFAFSTNNKGFVGGGFSNGQGDFKDFFEYDPNANAWTQRADFGGGKRMGAATFSINQKGFVATGYSSSSNEWYKDLWDYDPGQNLWTRRADLPGHGRTHATGFALAGNGYVGLGYSGSGYEGQFFQYTLSTNSWSWKPYYPGPSTNTTAVGLAIGNRAFVYKDGKWWEYNLLTINSINNKYCSSESAVVAWDASGMAFASNNTFTAEISEKLDFSNRVTLATIPSQASTGTISATVLPSVNAGTYFFRIRSSNPAMTTMLESITVTAIPATHVISLESGATVCKDVPTTFQSNLTGTGFQWYKNAFVVGTDSPTYTENSLSTGDVIRSIRFYSEGCKSTVVLNSNKITMTVKSPAKPVITPVPNTLQSTEATGYQWFMDGNLINGATNRSYTMTKNGKYKVRTVDNSGCFAFSDEVTNIYVGLDDESIDEQISIYPNPVANEMRLEIAADLVDQGCRYSIVNELGQTVVGTQPAERINKINLYGRSSGLYMLRLSLDGKTIVRRIIKVE